MKLREMFENEQPTSSIKTIGISFGRFNPPHKGHKGVWKAASKNPIWYVGTNDSTAGPKDPLPYDVKLQCMAAVFPPVAGHVVPEQSLLTLATSVYNKYGENVHLKVYTDETWLADVLVKYNGAESEHGMYKFKNIEHVATERLASATDLRKAVRTGDRDKFYKDMGIDPSVTVEVDGEAKPIFDVVAYYLNQYPEKVKKTVKAKEDAAGVGIITKQNSTVDVNKSTPKKNLRAFNLAEQLKELDRMMDEMRATEFLAELSTTPGAKMHKHHDDASQGHFLMRDVGGYDRTYHLNRIMMATAMADGKSKKPVDMPNSSWVEKYNVAFPYTDEEQMMMFQALATIPSDAKELSKRGKSKEPDDTNTVSAVAKPKRNQYGV